MKSVLVGTFFGAYKNTNSTAEGRMFFCRAISGGAVGRAGLGSYIAGVRMEL